MLKRLKRAVLYLLIGMGIGVYVSKRSGELISAGSGELTLRMDAALLKRGLAKRWGAEAAERILTAFRGHYAELAGDGMEAKGAMRFHLEAARQGLALYRALGEEIGKGEDLVEATHRLIWDTFLKTPFRIMGVLMGQAKDPFAGFVQGLQWVDAYVFPSTGWERTFVDVEDGIGIDFTGCFYYDYMREKGTPELTAAFCEMDVRQAELFPPQIEFRRTETLPAGYRRCDFRYYKKD